MFKLVFDWLFKLIKNDIGEKRPSVKIENHTYNQCRFDGATNNKLNE